MQGEGQIRENSLINFLNETAIMSRFNVFSTSLLFILVPIALILLYSPVVASATEKRTEKKSLEWVEDLKSPTQGTRTRATVALAKLKPTPLQVVLATADLLKDENPSVRAQVLMVLGNMGKDASVVLPRIMAALNDENKNVRRSAANSLTRIPATTCETQLALVRALEASDRHLRSQAERALGVLPECSAAIVPELVRIAESDNRQAGLAAFHVLERQPAAEVVPLLTPMLGSEDQFIRQNAARIIGNSGPEAGSAVPTLIALLDQYPHYLMAVHTLGRIGPPANSAVPALLALFQRSDPSCELRLAATGVLCRIGPDPQQVLPLFRKELAQQDIFEASGRYRAALAAALLSMSGPGDPAIRSYSNRLVRHLSYRDPFSRVEAVKGLLAIGPAAAPAIDDLQRLLRNDREPKIRALAAQALGEIGGAAHPALPSLRRAQQDDEPYVSKRAAEAMEKIETDVLH